MKDYSCLRTLSSLFLTRSLNDFFRSYLTELGISFHPQFGEVEYKKNVKDYECYVRKKGKCSGPGCSKAGKR